MHYKVLAFIDNNNYKDLEEMIQPYFEASPHVPVIEDTAESLLKSFEEYLQEYPEFSTTYVKGLTPFEKIEFYVSHIYGVSELYRINHRGDLLRDYNPDAKLDYWDYVTRPVPAKEFKLLKCVHYLAILTPNGEWIDMPFRPDKTQKKEFNDLVQFYFNRALKLKQKVAVLDCHI